MENELKTLKELHKYDEKGNCVVHPGVCIEEPNPIWYKIKFVSEEQLKQEAINWIKEYDRLCMVAINANQRDMANVMLSNKSEFMKFFNITGMDLQDVQREDKKL